MMYKNSCFNDLFKKLDKFKLLNDDFQISETLLSKVKHILEIYINYVEIRSIISEVPVIFPEENNVIISFDSYNEINGARKYLKVEVSDSDFCNVFMDTGYENSSMNISYTNNIILESFIKSYIESGIIWRMD